MPPAASNGGRAKRGVIIIAALLTTLLLSVTVFNSTRWIGTTFPGFFVMANRVIPSVSLPGWFDVPSSHLFQHQVLAVNGVPVTTSGAVYRLVREQPSRSLIRYTLRQVDGAITTEVVQSRVFSEADYALLFGAFLVNGAAYALIGLTVFWLKPRRPASLGLLSAGVAVGVWAMTATDLYGPHWFFRIHVLAESFLPAGFIHLALVFPRNRIRRHRLSVLLMTYLPFFVLAVAYEISLDSPSWYSAVHLLATAAFGFSGVVVVTSVMYHLLTTDSPLLRRRVGVVALGTLFGFVPPILFITASGLLGGRVAINAAAFTGLLFPLSLGYAIVKQDLFEIDILLRRAVTYVIVIVTIAGVYFAVLYLCGLFIPDRALVTQSPAALALLNLGLLFLIAPVRHKVQQGVDRWFFRQQYDAEAALSTLSHALGSVYSDEDVVARTLQVFAETFSPVRAGIYLRHHNRWTQCGGGTNLVQTEIKLPHDLTGRLERGSIVARYEWDDGSGRPLPAIWRELQTELLVPIRTGDVPIALAVLGPKNSGRSYSVHDLAFLRTVANQVALALTNAAAFGQMRELNRSLEELNLNLERQVRERTGAVHAANTELQSSLNELRHAYQQLEQKQASLVRSDRLATLGRLTAGIAHEMNTPLSAVLNALKIVSDLAREYNSSIEDPEVLAEDHREIAGEILSTAQAAAQWANKAAAFLRSVKTHGREPQRAGAERFPVAAVIADTRALLAHRLRAASCHIDYREESEGITVVGEASRLSQVLLNLVGNAIDAYEDAGVVDGRIEVEVSRAGDMVTISVRDRAGGIPAQVLPHIFDELFTTKGPGRGTGLGLWISRNIIEEGFGGTIDVLTAPDLGSRFTISMPAMRAQVEPTVQAVGERAHVEGRTPDPAAAPTSEEETSAPARLHGVSLP